ncbi:collagen alpha-1(III) chain-like [Pteropus medius]|uniref:collagen alpha-1(III) chain-like n=1 Tax=Pteropus vampyrus TaxID=132908 RepID=UPI00196ACB72|nr:collagen alpha-1(III) chain-like [Pteropus giganteus]
MTRLQSECVVPASHPGLLANPPGTVLSARPMRRGGPGGQPQARATFPVGRFQKRNHSGVSPEQALDTQEAGGDNSPVAPCAAARLPPTPPTAGDIPSRTGRALGDPGTAAAKGEPPMAVGSARPQPCGLPAHRGRGLTAVSTAPGCDRVQRSAERAGGYVPPGRDRKAGPWAPSAARGQLGGGSSHTRSLLGSGGTWRWVRTMNPGTAGAPQGRGAGPSRTGRPASCPGSARAPRHSNSSRAGNHTGWGLSCPAAPRRTISFLNLSTTPSDGVPQCDGDSRK